MTEGSKFPPRAAQLANDPEETEAEYSSAHEERSALLLGSLTRSKALQLSEEDRCLHQGLGLGGLGLAAS